MGLLNDYGTQLRRFRTSARLYLAHSFISGFSFGILRLLFNFYVLSLGYDRAFLGLIVALPPIVITVVAIPVGILGHRIGYRVTVIIGAVFMVGALLGVSLSTGGFALALFAVLRGLSRTLLQVSSAPFMAENSGSSERTHLFSVQFATRMLASFFGFLLAGVLPTLFGWLLTTGPESPLAYRAALWVAAGLFATSILPLAQMRGTEPPNRSPARSGLRQMFHAPRSMVRLFLPQVIIGFGAGALVPFLNVYLKARFDLSDAVIGLLYAFQSVFMAIATLIGPLLAQRLRRIRAIVLVQLLSIPFLVLLGYAPWISLSAIGFLARASLMNMANPLYTAFAMDTVGPDRRPTASALMQMSWEGTRGISAVISGQIQQGVGFSALFPITIGCYLLASALIHTFFGRGQDDPETLEQSARHA